MITASFICCLLVFLVIGLWSVKQSRRTRRDYYLASNSIQPWLAGLSAVATNNSGYMFIGVIGYTYTVGLSAAWLMLGWIVGDFLASLYIHGRLREATARTGEASFGTVLATWQGGEMVVWRRLAAIITVLFLGSYAAAQIAAGGKALHGILDWPSTVGAWVVAGVILAYCLAGGIRASIWTDAAQSVAMMLVMGLLFLVAIDGRGGWSASIAEMDAIDGFLSLVPPDLLLPGLSGLLLFVVGWMFAGISVIGQPHVMVRFMALDRPESMVQARIWYYSFFTLFYLLATGVGMLSRLYLPGLADLDPEMALPTMALELLPPVLVGVVLAGIFAATMSTADSLVLACSAAITHDLVPDRLEAPWALKMATAGVTCFALLIALTGTQSVFSLVILSWSTLAVAFGPFLFLLALGRRVPQSGAIAMMLAGVAVALGWRLLGWQDSVYEGMPGMLTGLFVGYVLSAPARRNATLAVPPA
jgi:SSS family solute:Na+ symporter/sodium/proline symporter